jgi:hypothetical protein
MNMQSLREGEQFEQPVGQGDYVVRAGDSIDSIAVEHGHFWETIWNDSGNSELKNKRKDPNVLLASDLVTIPPLRKKAEERSPEAKHRFKRKGVPAKINLAFTQSGEPRAHEKYVMDLDGKQENGELDGDGRFIKAIPNNARELVLYLGDAREEFRMKLGGIDPIRTVTGLQQRLNALGYPCGRDDGELDDQTRSAIGSFQSANGVDPTGTADSAFCDKLKSVYGC